MKKKHNKRYVLFAVALILGVSLALLVASAPSFTVEVDADDVVKITKIVNYKDKMNKMHYGAKMNIIVFTGGE